ncbi:hypothetical protein TNCV_3342471 [Trichonephila clavipes]|nr:hypothetical protein TNCV_3342471 [Trichonephila clavipes]
MFQENQFINSREPIGWRSWFVAGLLHPRIQVRPRPKSVDFHDAENRRRPCRMIMRLVKKPLKCPFELGALGTRRIASYASAQRSITIPAVTEPNKGPGGLLTRSRGGSLRSICPGPVIWMR